MLTEAERREALRVAAQIDRQLGISEQVRAYDEERYDPALDGAPVLHIDDLSGIPFLDDIVGVEFYQLRARVRAGQGDLFAATCAAIDSYERYNRERLGLGAADFVRAEVAREAVHPIQVAEACRHGEAFRTVVGRAREAGALLIHPYMGIEAVWELARDVRLEAGVPVGVLAPPPPVTWLANDKNLMSVVASALVEPALGHEAVVATRVGESAVELADHLLELAARRPTVGLKMTRCASAMGNRVIPSAHLLGLGRDGVIAEVAAFLTDKQWAEGDPVLAVAWEETDLSPSTQTWIPTPAEGPPRLDGVYEQLLEGPEKIFLGAIPARLDPELTERMKRASLLMATAYQALGYVGRCSFDFIVPEDGRPYLTECNGRWGGTSTPMNLVDRLFPAGRPPYRARDFLRSDLVGADFAELEARIDGELYDARTGRGRFVLYNVGCLPGYGKFDAIAVGGDLDEAERALEERLPELLGP